jgi:leucyl/phenylalanyl-tRNA--protein transferase
MDAIDLTPSILLRAYASGIFPMGDDVTGDVHWFRPDPRGILPLDGFHVPHNLRKRVRQQEFAVTSNAAFERVLRACADRSRTWITAPIIEAYTALHRHGFAHSVECWTDDDTLAGGLYGVALGGAFFGESMFFRVSNASKVALVHLVRQLRAGGFVLLDTQYSTPHLEQFGVVEVSRAAYESRLEAALQETPTWWPLSDDDVAAQDPASERAPLPEENALGNEASADG